MKSILQCYTPQECERIARGEQTVKVCKTAPKDTPFKVYIYKSKHKGRIKIINDVLNSVYASDKIVGEYICDKVIKYDYQTIACAKYEVNGADVKEELRYNAGACLTADEMYCLANGKDLKGLHISELKIYDEPRELSEFKKHNRTCKFSDLGYAIPNCKTCRDCNLTHPPQSWCYVEDMQ